MKLKSLCIFVSNKKINVVSTLVKILVILVFTITVAHAQKENTQDIIVNISGLDNDKGRLLVGLYNSEANFLDQRFMSVIGEISNKTGKVVFTDVPEGIYAVSFIHDENNNGKMDTNFLGIPKEDYGCSNNARGTMGPPKWKDAKFELKGESKIITITL
ncbi:uncharacterized protein (DUF2141 family) [Winogradskyella wandonensis]|uniref:Uncharacterized protein (DUF2141 family) n=1 Tax=Winogradskyella wandonensis TaxID=1442586 RepID=A0A4R1KVW0_9FLAO|nr:DUF2141 domain-containing protein [Winogradskyella wandonensis]TCK68857.1 uncharacterized protein (DUF2141 family) [Winogradskyella wandonensis]